MFETFLTEVLKLAPRQMWGVEQQLYYLTEIFTSFSPKKIIASLLAIIELFGLTLFDLPTTPRGEALDLNGYSLVFEDEFNGTQLNTDAWEYRGSGPRRGGFNAESQVRLENGNMILSGEYLTDGEYGEGWYTGMVKLKERYCKGYFEIRCIVNSGEGFWSAFWLQADSPYNAAVSKGGIGGAEIDIFESMSWENKIGKDSVVQTVHCAGVDGIQEGFQSERLGAFYGDNIYEEYNTYGLEWTDDEYIFYVNGVETRRTSFGNGVSEVLEDVIVSLEIPDEDKLSQIDKDSYKTEYIIDYVRIYQK
ncbi:MAG: glycosyl hydrolase family protein [Ruminococcaceae bacterium]|nr:glycosyl hydrolase family protein [Oscillospiraceae bacterium]